MDLALVVPDLGADLVLGWEFDLDLLPCDDGIVLWDDEKSQEDVLAVDLRGRDRKIDRRVSGEGRRREYGSAFVDDRHASQHHPHDLIISTFQPTHAHVT